MKGETVRVLIQSRFTKRRTAVNGELLKSSAPNKQCGESRVESMEQRAPTRTMFMCLSNAINVPTTQRESCSVMRIR